MRTLLVAILVGLAGTTAFAGLDPATDSFGIYFDLDGTTNCTTAGAFQPLTAYLILMNPAGPTNGFECSVAVTGVPHFFLSTVMTDCMIDTDYPPGDYWCGSASDYTARPGGAVILVTWVLMLQSPGELLFHIGPSSIPSLPGGLPVVTGNGVLRQCGVASGDISQPVAGINAALCPVGDEVSSFGRVKSLFR
jgi:hypothetical protein